MTRAASPAMSDKSQANKLGAILLSKGLALNAAMIKPGWFVIYWPFDTITSDLHRIVSDTKPITNTTLWTIKFG